MAECMCSDQITTMSCFVLMINLIIIISKEHGIPDAHNCEGLHSERKVTIPVRKLSSLLECTLSWCCTVCMHSVSNYGSGLYVVSVWTFCGLVKNHRRKVCDRLISRNHYSSLTP